MIVALAASSCGNGTETSGTHQIAFLRAVPGQGPDPVVDELAAAGFVVGDNVELIQTDPYGEVHTDPDSAEAAAERWVADGVDLIFAYSSSGARAAAAATADVPILFLLNDPTAVGLITDEASPEGNLTGVTFRVPADRTIELARRAIPGLDHLGIILPTADPAAAPARDAAVAAANDVALTVTEEGFADADDIDRAVASLADAGVAAILVVNAPTSVRSLPAIESAATARGLPLIGNTTFAPGATIVLEPDVGELQSQLGRQAARLLGGASVADVPVEDPRQFRLVLDAARAAALGLPEFPADLVRQADDVIL